MKIFIFLFTLVPGSSYDMVDIFVVKDSTFINKISQQNHRPNEKDGHSDSDLYHKNQEISSEDSRTEPSIQKFEYCNAYLNSGKWKKTIQKDTLRTCAKTNCRESRFDNSRHSHSKK